METRDIQKAANQYVAKSNELILKAKKKLTLQQERILDYVISKIRPDDTPDTEYEITIHEFCSLCGINEQETGYYYKSIKDDFKNLEQPFWILGPNGTHTLTRFITNTTVIPLCGTISFKFHDTIYPHLFNLKERARYTQYRLKNILPFDSKYSINIYQFLRSQVTEKMLEKPSRRYTVKFTVEELQIAAGTNYSHYYDFARKVLKIAVDEINAYNPEMIVEFSRESIKGKLTNKVLFLIRGKTQIETQEAEKAAESKRKARDE